MKPTAELPVRIAGWDVADLDKEKLRIENMLRDLVEPRVAFTLREIPLADGKPVIVIRVPWSWAQPHMLRIDQLNRFYYRHSAGKDIMNVTQLRAAFALTTRLEEQIGAFLADRVAAIKSGTRRRTMDFARVRQCVRVRSGNPKGTHGLYHGLRNDRVGDSP